MTACFWNTQTNEFFYGNSRGQIFILDVALKTEKLIHEADQKLGRDLDIKMLWVTQKNALWFIQSNSVTIKSGLHPEEKNYCYSCLYMT
jgi:hypothetical protein